MLTLDGVCAGYGGLQILQEVSFEVRAGEMFALIGANGAGKTTTLRTISGIYRPTTGSITFEGRNLAALPSHEIVALGISQSPEGRQIFGSLSVRDNLMLGATRRADRASIGQELDYLVSLFPVLGERMNQSGGTLSGGEQQMLAIARALMAKPRLLLLDEPSLGLAPMLVNRIFAVISRLKETGVTILLVEQNARKALEIANRAYVMETGRIILAGDARELAANPEIEKAYLGG